MLGCYPFVGRTPGITVHGRAGLARSVAENSTRKSDRLFYNFAETTKNILKHSRRHAKEFLLSR